MDKSKTIKHFSDKLNIAISNAIVACERDGYSQVIYLDKGTDDDYTISRLYTDLKLRGCEKVVIAVLNTNGNINVYSNEDKIKSILEEYNVKNLDDDKLNPLMIKADNIIESYTDIEAKMVSSIESYVIALLENTEDGYLDHLDIWGRKSGETLTSIEIRKDDSGVRCYFEDEYENEDWNYLTNLNTEYIIEIYNELKTK